MQLPRNKSSLTEIFQKARIPKIEEFIGEYYVHMLTGLPSLRRFKHRKVFYSEGNGVAGYNVLFKNRKWGYFYLQENDSPNGVLINYQRKENTFISKGIRDYIRALGIPNIYLGRFNYLFMGKLYFLGYFSLSKV